MMCPICIGTGRELFSMGICPLCKGTGELPNDREFNPMCRACIGTGRSILNQYEICPVCGGWGKLPSAAPPEDSAPVPTVLFVEAGTPRKAHLELSSLLGDVGGDVRVCDPYYGTGTLLRLDLLPKSASVRFLTQHPDKAEASFIDRAINEFRAEHTNIEFRKHRGKAIHDRFLLTADRLILLGHGLKDLGGKDSFVVQLDRAWAADTIQEAAASFDAKWSVAAPLP